MRIAKYRQLIAVSVALLPWVAPGAEPPSVSSRLLDLRLKEAALASGADSTARDSIRDAYDALVVEYPQNAAVFAARGNYRWERQDDPQAVNDWQTALQFDPAQVDAILGLGGAALAAGEAVKAAGLHRRAVEVNPANASTHFALANILFLFRHELRDSAHPDEASLLSDALTHFGEAARLAPGSVEYARAFAETFYSLPTPDWERARQAWEKVRDLSATKDFALVNLARVHLRLGQFDTSRNYLDQVLSPDFQRVKARLEAQLTVAMRPTAPQR